MEFLKKHKIIIGVVLLVLVIACFYFSKEKQESGYATKCPCPGVQQPGGGMYYNTACCKKATGTKGSAANGIA